MDANSLPDFEILPYPARSLNPHDDQAALSQNEPLTLYTSSSWTYCGPLLALDSDQLPSSFHTWATATVNGPLLTPLFSFLAFAHEFLLANDMSHYWLTIRASQSTHDFDIPRWHTDDLFFSPRPRSRRPIRFPNIGKTYSRHARNESNTKSKKELTSDQPNIPGAQIQTTSPTPTNWKLTTTLLGPGTLFIAQETSPQARTIQRNAKSAVRATNHDHICLSVRCIGCAMAAESVRTKLAAEFGGYEIVQARQGECVFFRVGEGEGAVHSEPVLHEDRIFINLVPGTEDDLKRLMGKWGMEYPRAWCVGLPFQMDEVDLRQMRRSRSRDVLHALYKI